MNLSILLLCLIIGGVLFGLVIAIPRGAENSEDEDDRWWDW